MLHTTPPFCEGSSDLSPMFFNNLTVSRVNPYGVLARHATAATPIRDSPVISATIFKNSILVSVTRGDRLGEIGKGYALPKMCGVTLDCYPGMKPYGVG